MRFNTSTRSIALSMLLAGAAAYAPGAQAMAYTEFGAVVSLEAGWSQDTMALTLSAPVINPDNCPVWTAGYATDPADPGHDLFHTVALAAFLNRKEVSVLVSGCVYNKPKIISVKVR